jgi:hypothetical protein
MLDVLLLEKASNLVGMSKNTLKTHTLRFRPGRALVMALAACFMAQLPACNSWWDDEFAQAFSRQGGGTPTASERFELSLDGAWQFVQDPENLGLIEDWAASIARSGEPPPSAGSALGTTVPGAFESRQSAGPYDGVVWYWRTAVLPRWKGGRAVLSFGRVNHACTVWVNDREVGRHVGGYDPFELDVSEAVGSGREFQVVVRVVDPGLEPVDGMTLSMVPHAKESWYENFGGILGPVAISGHADVTGRIEWLQPNPATGEVLVDLQLQAPDDGRSRHVEVELRVRPLALRAALPREGALRPPTLRVTRRRVRVQSGGERLSMSVQVPGHQLWEPEAPWRYLMDLEVHGDAPAEEPDDELSFGFRTAQLTSEGFFLNGRRRVLQGVLYQPHYIALGGLYPSAEQLQAEVLQMLETGFNLTRAHVRPAPVAFLDACDRYGLLVLEEPSIGWVDMSPELEGWLKHEVEWMVKRDHHHPSIVMWGLFNELSGKAHLLSEPVMAHLLSLDESRPALEDSGGFFKSGYVPAGGRESVRMLDEHVYPPCPIPFEERERLRTFSSPGGPLLVSEYGYGALIDTERNFAEFERRGVLGVERNTFMGMRERTLSARDAGYLWDAEAWLDASAAIHSSMSVEMLGLLRSNEHLAGSIYTQWQAVSSESSAGLLDPWGTARPALSAMSAALAPLQVNVFPTRASSALNSLLRVDLAVVNDTGQPIEAEVVLNAEGAVRHADGAVGRGFGRQVFPPGVTRLSEEAFRMTEAGVATFRAYFVDGAGEAVAMSRLTTQVVVPPAPTERVVPDGEGQLIALVAPDGTERTANFAAREGFSVAELDSTGTSVPVILLEDPKNLGESVSTAEQLRIWRHVYEGGAVILLAEDIPEDHIGRLAGSLRGVRLLPYVPVRFGIGFAAGNFMGRCHVALVADQPRTPGGPLPFVFDLPGAARGADRVPPGSHERLFRPEEASLSPAGVIVGALPDNTSVAAMTLNHYRQRVGALIAAMPFGRGKIVFVGVPLLDPILGEPDPLRDRMLSELIESVAFEIRNRVPEPAMTARPLPLTELQLEEYAEGMARLTQISDVGVRYSFITAGRVAPASLALVPASIRDQGLISLFSGQEGAWEHLRSAFDGIWTDDVARFVQRERQILEELVLSILGASPQARKKAAQVVQDWGHGVMAWVHGNSAEAHERLNAAEELLAGDFNR